MFVYQKALSGQQLAAAFFRRGTEREWRRLAEQEAQARIDSVLTAYGAPLSQVTSFKYLGKVLTADDNIWTAVVCKLRHAR